MGSREVTGTRWKSCGGISWDIKTQSLDVCGGGASCPSSQQPLGPPCRNPPLMAWLAEVSSVQFTERRATHLTSRLVGVRVVESTALSRAIWALPELRQGWGEASLWLSGMNLPCEKGDVSFLWSCFPRSVPTSLTPPSACS